MIPVQPTFKTSYFQLKKGKKPQGIKCLFYLSWEDALWDILDHKKVKKRSVILIPDFYCGDVEENIRIHGYRIARYKILANLKADKKSFEKAIKKYKPAAVIVFHPVGITSNLFDNPKWLIKAIGNSILIEDSVHRILSAEDIKIIKSNHFIIDSLRKVLPLQGSRVYGRADDLNFSPPRFFQSWPYRTKVNLYWFLMTVCWTLGFSKQAERLMERGYEIIGDSIKPSRGGLLFKILAGRVNIEKIQNQKIRQAKYYGQHISRPLFKQIKIDSKDYKNLRGFPVILPIKYAEKFLITIRSKGLFLKFELNDCPWSKRQKILYLPLGLSLNQKNQIAVCRLVTAFYGG